MKRNSTCITTMGMSIVLVCVSMLLPATVWGADHRDGPRITDSNPTLGNLDLNDLYVFQAPNKNNTVMILTAAPGAGVVSPAFFFPGALYEFRMDNNGDLNEDIVVQLVFSQPDQFLRQSYVLRAFNAMGSSEVLARGVTSVGHDSRVRIVPIKGGGRVTAGIFDDPFFFDALAFMKFLNEVRLGHPLGARVAPFLPPSVPNNFFANFNTLAIVLEVPSARLRSGRNNPNIAVWVRTVADVGDGRGFAQFDRTALPGINTAVIPPTRVMGVITDATRFQELFNYMTPRDDIATRPLASMRIQEAYGLDAAKANSIAATVLPDLMPFNTTSSAGFLNGRRLTDDVIDAEFDLLTAGALKSDRVINDSVFRKNFPYLGTPLPREATLNALKSIAESQNQVDDEP